MRPRSRSRFWATPVRIQHAPPPARRGRGPHLPVLGRGRRVSPWLDGRRDRCDRCVSEAGITHAEAARRSSSKPPLAPRPLAWWAEAMRAAWRDSAGHSPLTSGGMFSYGDSFRAWAVPGSQRRLVERQIGYSEGEGKGLA